jgi:hypothetical protein
MEELTAGTDEVGLFVVPRVGEKGDDAGDELGVFGCEVGEVDADVGHGFKGSEILTAKNAKIAKWDFSFWVFSVWRIGIRPSFSFWWPWL